MEKEEEGGREGQTDGGREGGRGKSQILDPLH